MISFIKILAFTYAQWFCCIFFYIILGKKLKSWFHYNAKPTHVLSICIILKRNLIESYSSFIICSEKIFGQMYYLVDMSQTPIHGKDTQCSAIWTIFSIISTYTRKFLTNINTNRCKITRKICRSIIVDFLFSCILFTR